jgi:hypothetical protein
LQFEVSWDSQNPLVFYKAQSRDSDSTKEKQARRPSGAPHAKTQIPMTLHVRFLNFVFGIFSHFVFRVLYLNFFVGTASASLASRIHGKEEP